MPQGIDDEGRRVRPPSVQWALARPGPFGDALEGQAAESDFGEFGNCRVEYRLFNRRRPPPSSNWSLDGGGETRHGYSLSEQCFHSANRIVIERRSFRVSVRWRTG